MKNKILCRITQNCICDQCPSQILPEIITNKFFDGLSVLKREFWSETIFIKKWCYVNYHKQIQLRVYMTYIKIISISALME